MRIRMRIKGQKRRKWMQMPTVRCVIPMVVVVRAYVMSIDALCVRWCELIRRLVQRLRVSSIDRRHKRRTQTNRLHRQRRTVRKGDGGEYETWKRGNRGREDGLGQTEKGPTAWAEVSGLSHSRIHTQSILTAFLSSFSP